MPYETVLFFVSIRALSRSKILKDGVWSQGFHPRGILSRLLRMRDRLNPKGSEAPREGLPMRGPMKVNPYGIMSIERQGLRIKLIEYSQTLPQGETPVLLTF